MWYHLSTIWHFSTKITVIRPQRQPIWSWRHTTRMIWRTGRLGAGSYSFSMSTTKRVMNSSQIDISPNHILKDAENEQSRGSSIYERLHTMFCPTCWVIAPDIPSEHYPKSQYIINGSISSGCALTYSTLSSFACKITALRFLLFITI